MLHRVGTRLGMPRHGRNALLEHRWLFTVELCATLVPHPDSLRSPRPRLSCSPPRTLVSRMRHAHDCGLRGHVSLRDTAPTVWCRNVCFDKFPEILNHKPSLMDFDPLWFSAAGPGGSDEVRSASPHARQPCTPRVANPLPVCPIFCPCTAILGPGSVVDALHLPRCGQPVT